ncbi:transposase [Nitrosomonas sp. Nm166]|uniref:REP-associated tyrosine transposase n=1 Tax=Nitrosomonas sp. Nm166 TaxID=1881054 RepID=UPI0008EB91D3|nr:transposase [Nitrosomonas sp. Nm166]SFE19802.1 putative transposase [Nitrosomonas sp. Nm166]
MSNYRRVFIPGGTWFFTVNLLQRHNNDLLVREINLLREAVKRVRKSYPFRIDAWVVLPEHLHCVWTLPPGDADFSTRWRLIKSGFSRALPRTEYRSNIRKAAGERGIWQRRYWKHLIRDDTDYQRHVDYVHVNLFKHGHVRRVADWPYSTFHQYVARGIYSMDWCGDANSTVGGDV